MTIETTINRKDYAGNGTTVAFSFPYLFFADADLVVLLVNNTTLFETPQTLNTNYTVSGAGNAAGGTVTMTTAPAVGYTLVIYRDPALTQAVDLVNNDPLDVDAEIETPLDKLTMICQRIKELALRSFRLSDGDTSGASLTIAPDAGLYVRWNAAGNALENAAIQATYTGMTAYGQSLLDSVDDAAARAMLGVSDDNLLVHLAGEETIPGNKTLSGTTDVTGDVKLSGSSGLQAQVLRRGATKPQWGTAIVDRRQTVLSGGVDSNGQANFLSAGSGLAVNLAATTTPVAIAFAAGYDDGGPLDYVKRETADVVGAWSGLAASNVNYLLWSLNTTTGALSRVSTIVPVQEGEVYDRTKAALLHFEGSDASTSIIDDYGNTWAANGNAQIDTAQFKFGTASLLLDGTGDYAESTNFASLGDGSWSVECFVRWNTLPSASSQFVFGLTNASGYGMQLALTDTAGTKKTSLYLSSTGSSWDVANATLGTTTTWATGAWRHLALVYDAVAGKYFVYVNGVLDTTVTSTARIASVTRARIGVDGSAANGLNGWVDEFRFSPCCRYPNGTTFTPPTSAFAVEGYFFSIPAMTMYQVTSASATAGTNPGMTAIVACKAGEVTTNGTGVASVVTYALRGRYCGSQTNLSAGTAYVYNHNIGTKSVIVESELECISADAGYSVGERAINAGDGNSGTGTAFYGLVNSVVTRNSARMTTGVSGVGVVNSTGTPAAPFTTSKWIALYTARRTWG